MLLSFGVVALAMFSGCGSSDSSAAPDSKIASSSDDADSIESGDSKIIESDTIYSVEDFTAVGYKNVTVFELDTLPGAIDAWYGFYSQKDFELRFYASHQVAVEQGLTPAEIAVGKGAVGYSKQPPLRFDAYAIVGNVVMLCELALESCESLIAAVDQ